MHTRQRQTDHHDQAPQATRVTRQRSAISACTDAMPGVFSAEELLASARVVEPRIGIATVYRALTAMTDSGYIEQVDARDGAALYARCRSVGHHHHLVCTSCGRVEEAECHLDDMIERLRATRGFVVTAHDLNLSGLCAECVDNRGVA